MTRQHSTAREIARIHMALDGIEPRIWRRVDVPVTATLSDLHLIIQAVFAWEDYHLYEFHLPGLEPGEFRQSIRLSDCIDAGWNSFRYLYDLGDQWWDAVKIEGVLEAVQGERYPQLVDGVRCAPPEDVGGTSGYSRFCSIMQAKGHPEKREIREWYGRPFEADVFNSAATAERLERLRAERAKVWA